MVIGNKPQVPTRLFDQGQTISSQIATTFNEAAIGLQTSSLIALGLALLAITILLNIVARLLVRRVAGDGVGVATGG
jgi:phosphate transport system permease protein